MCVFILASVRNLTMTQLCVICTHLQEMKESGDLQQVLPKHQPLEERYVHSRTYFLTLSVHHHALENDLQSCCPFGGGGWGVLTRTSCVGSDHRLALATLMLRMYHFASVQVWLSTVLYHIFCSSSVLQWVTYIHTYVALFRYMIRYTLHLCYYQDRAIHFSCLFRCVRSLTLWWTVKLHHDRTHLLVCDHALCGLLRSNSCLCSQPCPLLDWRTWPIEHLSCSSWREVLRYVSTYVCETAHRVQV